MFSNLDSVSPLANGSAHATAQHLSPRTATMPMAFTGGEFFRGAFSAWGWFCLLFLPASLLAGLITATSNQVMYGESDSVGDFLLRVAAGSISMVVFGALYSAPWTGAALVVFTPIAYLFGLGLRKQSRRGIHLAAFAVLGIVVSGATTAAIVLVVFPGPGGILIPYSVAAAIAVPLGWRRTATRALRGDVAVAETLVDAGLS